MSRNKPMKILRYYFVTGMIVIIPLWITILVIKAFVNLINGTFHLLPPVLQPRTYFPYFGIELLVALALIIFVGAITSNIVGKKIFGLGEIILARIPFVKTIYQGVKHLTTGIVGEKKLFSEVVLIDYPIKGLYFIGFVTGDASSILGNAEGKRMLKVFIPTTPNPTSGFFCVVPEDKVKPLAISINEAFKLIISAGFSELESGEAHGK